MSSPATSPPSPGTSAASDKYVLFQTIISATQSRKKQQTELVSQDCRLHWTPLHCKPAQVRSVLYAEKDKKRKERESLPITSLPVEMLAAQEPSLSSAAGQDQVMHTFSCYSTNKSPQQLLTINPNTIHSSG